MIKSIRQLFLSPNGRIKRTPFIVGVTGLYIFALFQKFIFANLGTGMAAFYIPMVFFFLTIHIVICIFGKRLHDLGRSLWPLTGFIVIVMIIALLVSLNFGGLEYLETVIAHPEYAGNEAEMKRVQKIYQNTLAQNLPTSSLIMAVLPILFTVWLAATPSSPAGNRYGPQA